jgi:hypothetical protein
MTLERASGIVIALEVEGVGSCGQRQIPGDNTSQIKSPKGRPQREANNVLHICMHTYMIVCLHVNLHAD